MDIVLLRCAGRVAAVGDDFFKQRLHLGDAFGLGGEVLGFADVLAGGVGQRGAEDVGQLDDLAAGASAPVKQPPHSRKKSFLTGKEGPATSENSFPAPEESTQISENSFPAPGDSTRTSQNSFSAPGERTRTS